MTEVIKMKNLLREIYYLITWNVFFLIKLAFALKGFFFFYYPFFLKDGPYGKTIHSSYFNNALKNKTVVCSEL